MRITEAEQNAQKALEGYEGLFILGVGEHEGRELLTSLLKQYRDEHVRIVEHYDRILAALEAEQ